MTVRILEFTMNSLIKMTMTNKHVLRYASHPLFLNVNKNIINHVSLTKNLSKSRLLSHKNNKCKTKLINKKVSRETLSNSERKISKLLLIISPTLFSLTYYLREFPVLLKALIKELVQKNFPTSEVIGGRKYGKVAKGSLSNLLNSIAIRYFEKHPLNII